MHEQRVMPSNYQEIDGHATGCIIILLWECLLA